MAKEQMKHVLIFMCLDKSECEFELECVALRLWLYVSAFWVNSTLEFSQLAGINRINSP